MKYYDNINGNIRIDRRDKWEEVTIYISNVQLLTSL